MYAGSKYAVYATYIDGQTDGRTDGQTHSRQKYAGAWGRNTLVGLIGGRTADRQQTDVRRFTGAKCAIYAS